ncbi:MAG: hypothetical protein V3T70_11975 [Phycisphaerae bacterium]
MRMPNFRLVETQARWSVYCAAVAGVGLVALTFLVFRKFDPATSHMWYNPLSTYGKFGQPLILLNTAIVGLLGVIAAGLGYNSLGERRNKMPRRSWTWLLLGALFATLALLHCLAWIKLSLPILQ